MDDLQINEQVLDSLAEAAPREVAAATEEAAIQAGAAAANGVKPPPSANGPARADASADAGRLGGTQETNFVLLWEKQRQRLIEYLRDSLARVDSIEANLGSAIFTLLNVQMECYQALEEAMARAKADPDEWEEMLRFHLDPYLRITKTLERYMASEMRCRRQARPNQLVATLASAV